VRLVNLYKRFDKVLAVDGVSLDIPDGDFVVLLGPSGCGKTTTLRCIAGLETPEKGEIWIGDTVVNDLPPKDRDVAMVFQNYALYPHMRVYDNLAFPLRMRKVEKNEIDRRVKEVADLLGIKHLLDRKPRQLSGGEQQRVALGRAIIRRPRVFLMDEPLSNLDAKLRLFMRAELKRLQRELKTTTVYVTHDQAEAMAMADKIAVMNKGKVQQYDDPSTIYNRPANTFVATFIGSPPMNMIKATLRQEGGAALLDAGSFSYVPSQVYSEIILKNAKSSEVFLGVRPEDIQISVTKAPNSLFLSEVYVVEHQGANMVVDLKIDSEIIKAITQPMPLSIGQRVWVGFDEEKTHVYDGGTEQLIV
ncbi:MAG: ABC transporter ATP-binding protein, partial [Aigarchaeota archaeon]|nr:ABC transporter ATP-binding protein [Candidatus Calditenuaceae archaeon]